MTSISHAIITGGTFTHYNGQQTNINDVESGFTLLRKTVAHGAFHNSGERFDPPRCHPNTRVAVIRKIKDWILGQDPNTRNAYIVWLHGAAGAGKSAIAQSIAELCYAEVRLAGSFFFGRSDPNRNHARSFIATLAYQIALSIPVMRSEINAIIEHNPLILTHSLLDQFLALIVRPLCDLSASAAMQQFDFPNVIVIDGLDECLNRRSQTEILDVIIEGITKYHLPFLFLVACRPELEISQRFSSPDTTDVLTRLHLDRSYLPDHDIELFLRDNFRDIVETHPFRQHIPTPWPSQEIFQQIVRKSSGQFIYASTVMKFVRSNRHQPHRRLDAILSLRTDFGKQPFEELDMLYMHIFSSVGSVQDVLPIIAFHLITGANFVKSIEQLFSLESGEIAVLFCDLASIIALHKEGTGVYLKILHASLSDFLLDQSRSGQFYIDLKLHYTTLLTRCLRFLGYQALTSASTHAAHTLALNFFVRHWDQCTQSADLWSVISSFPLLKFYLERSSFARYQQADSSAIRHFNWHFLPSFFSLLKRMSPNHKDGEFVSQHHQLMIDSLIQTHLEVYYEDTQLSFLVCLVDFFVNNKAIKPYDVIRDSGLFETDSDLRDDDYLALSLLPDNSADHWNYYEMMEKFLKDSHRSGPFSLDKRKYTSAAKFCLDHSEAGPLTLAGSHSVDDANLLQARLHCTEFFLQRADLSVALRDSCEKRLVRLESESLEPLATATREKNVLRAYLMRKDVGID